MAYELLMADADGTLFDFDAGEQKALTALFAHFDIPAREEFFQTYHRVNREQWSLLEQGRTTLPDLQVARMANFLGSAEPPEHSSAGGGGFLQTGSRADAHLSGD